MSKSATHSPIIKQRPIFCTQSTGRTGKSTFADGAISWLTFAGVPYVALDADVQHHTLSDRHPGIPLFEATASQDKFGQFLASLPTDKPVLLVDFPAQATENILTFSAHFHMLEEFERLAIRPTLLIFTADDSTAKNSAYDTLEFFGTKADYILVENSARFDSAGFQSTELYDRFIKLGAPTISIPRMSIAPGEWETAQHRLTKKSLLSLSGLLPVARYNTGKLPRLNWPCRGRDAQHQQCHHASDCHRQMRYKRSLDEKQP
jgi:hypothetical protein